VRVAVRVAPAVIGLAMTGWMAGSQLVRDLPPRFDWPAQFEVLRVPAWLALFLLVGEVLLGLADGPPFGIGASGDAQRETATHD
jgi:hypothetical protein